MVFLGNLLGTQMLLDGQRVIGSALNCRVVGDNHDFLAGYTTDTSHNTRSRNVVVVDRMGGQRRELEEGCFGIEQRLDTIAHEQLPARTVLFARVRLAALS